jgi:hypothetical protein
VVRKVQRILNRDIPLMILGETGTGKELLARAVHQDSHRAKQPFVAVNCASIPETLIEAELFGYEEGAFTGARRKGATGRILQANGGTLFLDEIGDMPLGLQAHLLRVLQERCVTPLGSQKSIPVDIAVVSATHRDLRGMIEQGKFREDLYYRLNGLVVRLPALRDRSDLAVVARRILSTLGVGGDLQISPAVMALFQRYQWPGNVRQLATVLRTAAVMAAGEPQITEQHLSDDFLDDVRRQVPPAHAAAESAFTPSTTAYAGSGFSEPVPAWAPSAPAARRRSPPRRAGGRGGLRGRLAHPGRGRDRPDPRGRRGRAGQHLAGLQAAGHQPQHHLPQAALGPEALSDPPARDNPVPAVPVCHPAVPPWYSLDRHPAGRQGPAPRPACRQTRGGPSPRGPRGRTARDEPLSPADWPQGAWALQRNGVSGAGWARTDTRPTLMETTMTWTTPPTKTCVSASRSRCTSPRAERRLVPGRLPGSADGHCSPHLPNLSGVFP